jgi:hypothetical protein
MSCGECSRKESAAQETHGRPMHELRRELTLGEDRVRALSRNGQRSVSHYQESARRELRIRFRSTKKERAATAARKLLL